jgi:hypothetical protein
MNKIISIPLASLDALKRLNSSQIRHKSKTPLPSNYIRKWTKLSGAHFSFRNQSIDDMSNASRSSYKFESILDKICCTFIGIYSLTLAYCCGQTIFGNVREQDNDKLKNIDV